MKANLYDLLGLLFIGLKLTDHIGWSWWWVTAPIWGGVILKAVIKTWLDAEVKKQVTGIRQNKDTTP